MAYSALGTSEMNHRRRDRWRFRALAIFSLFGSRVLAGASTGPLVEYQIPTTSASPTSIIVGSDGNLWFTEHFVSKIGRLTLSGQFAEFEVPFRGPNGIAAAPDGRLWFTETNLSELGVMLTDGSFVGEFLSSRTGLPAHPNKIVVGPDDNLWFTNQGARTIGRIKPDGSGLTEFAAPDAPFYITSGGEGTLWFTASGDHVGQITVDGALSEWVVPVLPGAVSNGVAGITAGPDGNVWFALSNSDRIARITSGGQISQFTLPSRYSSPQEIIIGPDGLLWFTEPGAQRIGRISTSGDITEYQLPTDHHRGPWSLTLGPDRAVWFTEVTADAIGRLTTDAFSEAEPKSIPTLSSWTEAFLVILLALLGMRLADS
jgi:virginiamycin B lyase